MITKVRPDKPPCFINFYKDYINLRAFSTFVTYGPSKHSVEYVLYTEEYI